jgi:hypothetical protein
MSDYASESGHWYNRDGTPAYTIVGKTGERPTTLRDARKLDLLPGCTKVMQEASRQGLERYFQRQIFNATISLVSTTLPSIAEHDSLFAEALKMSKEAGAKAAERGTEIHGALERSKKGQSVAPQFIPWLGVVHDELVKHCGLQVWKAEQSYAHKFGYGTKVDLHSANWLIDYKSKDDEVREDVQLWDEHHMQLAACRLAAGIPQARCAIVFFGRQTPWAKFVEAEEEDLRRGWDMFEALLTYWQSKNRMAR